MLEEAKAGALLFSSGMAAATAVFQALNPGDHVVASKVMYWALRHWLLTEATRWGLQVEFVETDDLDALRKAVVPGRTKLVWAETPSNPLWTITDIAGAAEIAHAAGARLAVDSTTASPYHTRPLVARRRHRHARGDESPERSLGRGGGGARRREGRRFLDADRHHPQRAGRDSRSLRGLSADARHAHAPPARGRTGEKRARPRGASGSSSSKVARVLYPGLPQHPGHDVAARQMENGFGYMLSVQVSDGEAAAIRTAARVRLWKRATSLGGVESLIEHRASIEGPGTPCPPDLLRLSTGIEDPEDLFADLDTALRAT